MNDFSFPDEYTPEYVPPKKRNGWLICAVVLIALIAVFLLCHLVLFKIRSIEVTIDFNDRTNPTGEVRIDEDALLAACGLKGNVNYFFLNEESIKNKINEDPVLDCISVEKQFPSKLVIHVKQRQKIACIEAFGRMFVVDEDGFILDKTQPDDARYLPLIKVTGLNIKNASAMVGSQLILTKQEQLQAFQTVIREIVDLDVLYVQYPGSQARAMAFSEVSFSSAETVTFTTIGATYLVTMNIDYKDSMQDVRPKLRTMMVMLNQMRNDPSAMNGGTLQIVRVGEAIFTPK